LSLNSKRKKKFKMTTNSDHDKVVAPDLLKRDFSQAKDDERYVSDITYIWTSEGGLYLAVVIDLVSRTVVGWGGVGMVTGALRLAIANRRPAAGLIHHSDRGLQYVRHMQATAGAARLAGEDSKYKPH
jgi:transposase InsO family protein